MKIKICLSLLLTCLHLSCRERCVDLSCFELESTQNHDLSLYQWQPIQMDQGLNLLLPCQNQFNAQTLPLIINEVLVNPNGTESINEMIEIANPNDHEIDLSGISLFEEEKAIIEFNGGCMPAQSLLTLYGSATGDEEALSYRSSQHIDQLVIKQKKFSLSNRQNLELSLYQQEKELDRFETKATLIKEGIALTRIKDGVSGMIVPQTEIDLIYALNPNHFENRFTPSKCNQNTLFENHCQNIDDQAMSDFWDFNRSSAQLHFLEKDKSLKCRKPEIAQLLINEIQLLPITQRIEDQWIELLNISEWDLSLNALDLKINGNQIISFEGLCMPKQSACLLFVNQTGNHILCSDHIFKEMGFEEKSLDELIMKHQEVTDFTAFRDLEVKLMLNDQTIIDQSFINLNNLNPFVSFNRSVDGVGGNMVLHQQNENEGKDSMLRKKNGMPW